MSLDLHQSFIEEFSEHRAEIEQLLENDQEFRAMLEEYQEIDQAVMSAEQNVSPLTDIEAEKLKKKRLKLKDGLFAKLQAKE